MSSLLKEGRRLLFQLRSVVRHGRLNPYCKTRRARKPRILRQHPKLEIGSPLEYIIAALGKPAAELFFVQIGAYDGISDEVLRELIAKSHCRGILVEPQVEAFERLEKTYAGEPQLILRNVAIAAADGEVTMYSVRNGSSQVASLDYHHVARHLESDIVERKVRCLTLRTLLSEANAPQVDFLQIDAEGFDAEIIRAIDFRAFKPPIIRYEHLNLLQTDRNQIIALLAEEGYRFLLEDADTIACLPLADRDRAPARRWDERAA